MVSEPSSLKSTEEIYILEYQIYVRFRFRYMLDLDLELEKLKFDFKLKKLPTKILN